MLETLYKITNNSGNVLLITHHEALQLYENLQEIFADNAKVCACEAEKMATMCEPTYPLGTVTDIPF